VLINQATEKAAKKKAASKKALISFIGDKMHDTMANVLEAFKQASPELSVDGEAFELVWSTAIVASDKARLAAQQSADRAAAKSLAASIAKEKGRS
jgi:hypothetical protein